MTSVFVSNGELGRTKKQTNVPIFFFFHEVVINFISDQIKLFVKKLRWHWEKLSLIFY